MTPTITRDLKTGRFVKVALPKRSFTFILHPIETVGVPFVLYLSLAFLIGFSIVMVTL